MLPIRAFIISEKEVEKKSASFLYEPFTSLNEYRMVKMLSERQHANNKCSKGSS